RCTYNQIDLKTNQLRCKVGQALTLLLGKSVLDGEILSLNPSKLAHFLQERVHEDRAAGRTREIQVTDAEDFSRLLRLNQRAKRKEHHAKSKDDDFSLHVFFSRLSTCHSPRHLITLSALASTFGGIVKPICFAVLRLI